MMGNTNEPSTRVRVSNIGVGEKGGCDAPCLFWKADCFICSHSIFFGGSYIKMCLKNKDVDLIEIAVFL